MADIDALFQMLLAQDGSDLHLCVGRAPYIRRHGDITGLELPAATQEDITKMITEIMPERNQKQFEETCDTDFAYEIEGLARFRCNVRMDRFGMAGVFRQIPCDVLTAEQLELPKGVTDFCYLSKGLVVVTGPTGSGKSTTLAAMIDLINKERTDHIITIEDPVEFVHQDQACLVTQREVHTHTMSFSNALRAALRQDPDIVMVGEMRDLETIETAIETAETGHLVFGTLHTSTAPSTIDRIIDAFPADRQNQIRTMLSTSLKGAIAQTLCKRKKGGRVAALEILIVDHGVGSLIRDGKTFQIQSAMQIGAAKGNLLLNDSLARLVAEDIVDPDEAYIKAVDKDDLIERLKKQALPMPSFLSDPDDEVHAEAEVINQKKGMFQR
ncbi:MAG: type IV pilus twitching motility protein PilT [Verrucomicrobia bacterium]|nr:type IV pilus twitching motility protein PilT [Verrucomicrobiota bacterium]